MNRRHSMRPPTKLLPVVSMIRAFLVLLLLATALPLFLGLSEARGQKPAATKARPQEQAPVVPEAPNTTIGDSGFTVTIPEIKMKRIIKDRPADRPVTPEEPASERVEDREPGDEPAIDWLPFDPARRRPVIVEPPETQPTQERTPQEAAPSVFKPPVAPEDFLVAPAPRTEVLKAERSPELPQILVAERSKDAKPAVALRSQAVEQPPNSEAEIRLGSRWEPKVIPPPVEPEPEPELEPERVAKTEAPSEPAPVTPPRPEEAEEPAPTQAPAPEPGRLAKAEPPSIQEPEPVIPPKPEVVPEPLPAPLPEVAEPPQPVEEAIASPLAMDAPSSPELREYLRAAAPILEELSLLMTRAPTLAIADYDPSDVNAAIFPEDIYLKLDAMKRELQILDAKTFSIIPPKNYAQFHTMIRDSIAETYQACDTIMRYMRNPTDQELNKIEGHLGKVRALIRKTRTGRG